MGRKIQTKREGWCFISYCSVCICILIGVLFIGINRVQTAIEHGENTTKETCKIETANSTPCKYKCSKSCKNNCKLSLIINTCLCFNI